MSRKRKKKQQQRQQAEAEAQEQATVATTAAAEPEPDASEAAAAEPQAEAEADAAESEAEQQAEPELAPAEAAAGDEPPVAAGRRPEEVAPDLSQGPAGSQDEDEKEDDDNALGEVTDRPEIAVTKPDQNPALWALAKTYQVLSSYGLAVVLLMLLAVLTYLGTIEQKELGLYETVNRYFYSNVVVHPIRLGEGSSIPLPLPGAYLVMLLFSVNLILGGLVRIRWSWRTSGVIVTHLGIALLMLAGGVTYHFTLEGALALAEGETSDVYNSYHDWELAFYPASATGDVEEITVPVRPLRAASPERPITVAPPGVPLSLDVSRLFINCQPVVGQSVDGPTVAGFAFRSLPKDVEEEENNWRGLYATLETEAGLQRQVMLYGASTLPLVEPSSGWAVELRRVRRRLPFQVELRKFHHERHPGLEMARAYRSEVTKHDEGEARQIEIKMNEPLRTEGYTLFQASFQEQPGGQLRSVFAVVNNPADQWPKYATYVIALGLLIQFGASLVFYIRAQQAKRAAA